MTSLIVFINWRRKAFRIEAIYGSGLYKPLSQTMHQYAIIPVHVQ